MRVFALVLTLAVAGSGGDAGALIGRAGEAFFKHDLGGARALYLKALASEPSETDRATAEIQLAVLAWRYYGNVEDARRRLAAAESVAAKRDAAVVERARMEASLGDFDAARAAASRALSSADPDAARRARTVFAAATVEQAMRAAVDAPEPARSVPPAVVREALATIRALNRAEPGLQEPSRLQVALGLLAGDGPATLEGWRSYYRVAAGATAPGLLAEPSRVLAKRLSAWRPTAANRRAVALALAGSAFFEEAALVARDLPEVRDVTVYARFVRRIRTITDEYYRKTAIGQGDPKAFQAALGREAEALWPQLAWSGKPPAFELEAVEAELAKRFRAEINLGTTAGYLDLHYGHRVVDDERTVEQYGHTARLRFVVLDGMVSNGFESWAWDGRAQHGGWASAEQITQVRPAYADDPLKTWRELTDPKKRRERDEEIARESAGDDARARANPTCYLPGLALRLRRQGLEHLLETVRARQPAGTGLQLRFMAEYERVSEESSIFAHEGRHAIDTAMGLDLTTADREYRAKLSQVVFTSEPRLAMGSIFSANIGNETAHGQANARAMAGVLEWMTAHAAEIAGLDRGRPLLPQFDLLADEQMRQAFASLDPFAASGGRDEKATDDHVRGLLRLSGERERERCTLLRPGADGLRAAVAELAVVDRVEQLHLEVQ